MTPHPPPESALPVAAGRTARRRIVRLLADRWRAVTGLVLLGGASTAATLAGPALIGVVVDAVTGTSGGRATVDRAAAAYAVLAVVGAVLAYLAGRRAAVVGESALAELRLEVYDHALDLPLDVIERAGTGEVVSRLTADVNVLNRAVRQTVPSVVFASIELVLTVVALVLVDWRLGLLAVVAGTPIAAVGGTWYLRHAPVRYGRERQAHADLATGLLQGYRGRSVLAAHRAHRRYRWAMAGLGRAVVDAELSTTSARNRLRPAVRMSLAASLVAVFVAGAAFVDAGTATIGAVSAAALYVIRLFDPVSVLLEELDEIQQSSAAVARLVGITQVPRHRPSAGQSSTTAAAARPDVGLDVEVVGVSFGYEVDDPVLDAVDLTVVAGERVVVVGASGAGKTTLAKLVAGLHRPSMGEVRIGGRCTHDLEQSEIARLVMLVSQEGHVFARTVAENLRLARPDASDADLTRALQVVGADAWVARLPLGTDTKVGDGGHRLSPPQAQQLGLARLVCADPAVVILDEATADLGPAAAARTEAHLAAALTGRTVLTIAHRLDGAPHADRVVVMEAGSILAAGPHHELVDRPGPYAELWRHWTADRAGLPSDVEREVSDLSTHTDSGQNPKSVLS